MDPALRKRMLVVGSLLLASFAIWWGSIDNSFHYDDEHSIQLNIHVRVQPVASELVEGIALFFTDPAAFSRDAKKGMYRPLLVTSFAMNHALNLAVGLDGYDVRGYHIVNLLIHAINGLLVFWLVRLLWPRRSWEVAWVASLLFISWPLGSEPVNYISSRSESLSALFYLLTMALFLQAHISVWRGWYWACWPAMAAGLLTKSTAITLPAALLLLDVAMVSRFDISRVGRRFWRWVVPAWGVAAAYLFLIISNGFLGRSLGKPVRDHTRQLLTQTKAIGHYLYTLVMPTHLSVEPQFREQAVANPTVLAGGLLAVTLVVALVWMWQRRHGSALCLVGIGLLHMLPTLVMPLNVLVNDRRAYVPMAMACIGIPALAMRFAPPLPLRALVVATLLIAAGLSAGRNQVWAEEGTLWSEAVARSPQMPRPHLFHGNAFKDRALHTQDAAQQSALWREAARAYERALRFPSDDDIRLRAYNNLGGIHLTLGNLEEAEQTFRRAIEHGPNYVDALINLGNCFVKKSRLPTSPAQREAWLEEAIGFFRRGLREEPNHFLGHSNLGVVLQDLGRWTEAEQSYRQALFLHPHHYGTLTNLAALLLRKAEQAQEENDRNRFLGDSEHLVRRSLTLNPAQDRAREILRLVTSARTSGGS